MNGYLVMLCHNLDDLPVKFCATRQEATDYGNSLDEMPTEEMRLIFNTDCSTPNCVKVVHFVDGNPVGVTMVKSLND
jgi:hypothetical protein